MKKVWILLLVLAGLWSCRSGGSGTAPTLDTSGYLVSDIPGLSAKMGMKKDAQGFVIEEGLLVNGAKAGTWVTYWPGSHFPKQVVSFEAGLQNGPFMEFNERGQLTLQAGYRNNLLHGFWAKYKFGRPEEEAEYQDGKLHGMYRIYFGRDGSLQSEAEYKNGVQDGVYRVYNDKGEVTLQYEYKNGEKIGGGIVDPSKANEPQ